MRSRRLVAFALSFAGAASASFTPPAAATAGPITVQANFVGSGTVRCFGGTCDIDVSSVTCTLSGVNGTRLPFVNGCEATLTGSVPSVANACAGVGGGSLSVSDPVSDNGVGLEAVIVGTPAVATFVTPALFSMSGFAYAGYGSGTVKPCGGGTEFAVFEGTFTYVRVL